MYWAKSISFRKVAIKLLASIPFNLASSMIHYRIGMSVGNSIKAINQFVKNKKVSHIERKRLKRDLDVVYKRLQKRDYEKTFYSTNVFDVPDRAHAVFVDVEFYALIGKTWFYLLKELEVNKVKTIADIAPGYIPKVELGLFYSGYSGNVVIIDKDKQAISQLVKFIHLFNPQFKIIKKGLDLFTSFDEKFDFVVANHVIDDFVIAYFGNKYGVSSKQMYEKEGELVRIWKLILSKKTSSKKEIVPVILSIFSRIVQKNGILCIAHYKSYIEKMLDMKGASDFNSTVFEEVVSGLIHKGFRKDVHVVRKAFKNKKGHFGANDCAVLRRGN